MPTDTRQARRSSRLSATIITLCNDLAGNLLVPYSPFGLFLDALKFLRESPRVDSDFLSMGKEPLQLGAEQPVVEKKRFERPISPR